MLDPHSIQEQKTSSLSPYTPFLPSQLPPTERTLMTTTIPTVPDEETPLLSGQSGPAIGGVTESNSEAATLASPSNQSSRTSTIRGKTSPNRESEVVRKTPLPWAQFSIIMFLQLAEPLTAQVISPVSFFDELIFYTILLS